MAEETDSQLAISLPRYDGPFDLLVALIRRNEYPIDELPVAAITGEFLAYVRAARELDQELAGEFVEVASWLVLLKSRSLLPQGTEEAPAPHEELRRAVLDHESLLAATELLRAREGRARPGASGARAGRDQTAPVDAYAEPPTVEDLLEASRRALEAARAARSLEGAGADGRTVAEMIGWVERQLGEVLKGEAVSTREWFERQPEAGAALLLALLEMGAKGALLLHQAQEFGPIRVKVPPGEQSRHLAPAPARPRGRLTGDNAL